MKKYIIVTLGVILALSGCSLLPKEQTTDLILPITPYSTSASSAKSDGEKIEGVIFLERPEISNFLNRRDIATIQSDGKISYVGGYKWVDAPSELIWGMMERDFSQQAQISAIVRQSGYRNTNYHIQPEVESFAFHFEGAESGYAYVVLKAKIYSRVNQCLIGTFRQESRTSASSSLSEIHTAFDQSTNKAVRGLSNQVVKRLSAYDKGDKSCSF